MKLKKIIFSYDRPIQLQGLCHSILKNTDLSATDILCLCRSSSPAYRSAYTSIGAELGVQIVHENRVFNGIDLRKLYQLTEWMPYGRRFISRQLYRLTTSSSLPAKILELTQDVDYVSLAVDDMVYFRQASFATAIHLMEDDPEIELWSWRIGVDRNPDPSVKIHQNYWTVEHKGRPLPYNYIFHTDGSVYRRATLAKWLAELPQNKPMTLNIVEGHLWILYGREPERFNTAPLHAGPLQQSCVTWQINRVSPTATAKFHAESYSAPAYLLERYLEGARLDYSALFGSDEWLAHLNRNSASWTHVAPTQEAVELWHRMVKAPSQ